MKRSEYICHLLGIDDDDKALNLLEDEFGAYYDASDISEMLDAYCLNQGEYDSRDYLLNTMLDYVIETDFIFRVAEANGTQEDDAYKDYYDDFHFLTNGELVTFLYRGYKFETNEELDQLIDDFANGKLK